MTIQRDAKSEAESGSFHGEPPQCNQRFRKTAANAPASENPRNTPRMKNQNVGGKRRGTKPPEHNAGRDRIRVAGSSAAIYCRL
jgi:hypothetical protein